MPSAMDVTPETEYLKCLLVGDSGTGKSTFGASCPTKGFVFDFDDGILSYRGKDFDYESYEKAASGWAKFERDFMAVKKEVEAGTFKTVLVDGTTSMADVCMERAMQLDPKRSQTNGPLWNVHYGMVKNMMEGALRKLLNLNCNVIIISHADYEKDEESGNILSAKPLLIGQLAYKLPGQFDEVYYTSTKRVGGETKFQIQTIPIGYNKARSRLSGKERLLPDFLENDFNVLMEHIRKEKE